ncbi:leucine-rich repeat-containing protein 61-like [Saccoglossus kowalevskii]|uniref:Leucine-rich repeat-containing protein 61-like n=1 Tax=Saccoglossus kowalevskii TaxID=10224 RepID=A0ABM0GIY0_SACKO|nr:PREDICTED: leucine-rich repeat-containing protein 61-like [Saccoglossus kowalevskii]
MAGTSENGKITRQMLKTRSGEFDLESIHTIIVKKEGIDDLGCIGECTSLQMLDASYNEISNVRPLSTLKQLTHLNLSANMISSLDPLKELENLKSLNIAGNLIGSTDALRCLQDLDDLESLRLNNQVKDLTNPICHSTLYKQTVLGILPRLKTLDGERVIGPGSELFRLCQELDVVIQSNSPRDGPVKEYQIPRPLLSDDFWNDKSTDDRAMIEAEKQIQDVLAECRKLSLKADEAADQAAEMLRQNTQDRELNQTD